MIEQARQNRSRQSDVWVARRRGTSDEEGSDERDAKRRVRTRPVHRPLMTTRLMIDHTIDDCSEGIVCSIVKLTNVLGIACEAVGGLCSLRFENIHALVCGMAKRVMRRWVRMRVAIGYNEKGQGAGRCCM